MLETQTRNYEAHGPFGGKYVRTRTRRHPVVQLYVGWQNLDQQHQDIARLAVADPEPEGYNPYDHSPPPPPEFVTGQ